MTDEQKQAAQQQLGEAIGAVLERMMGADFGKLAAVEVAAVMACGDGTFRTLLLYTANSPEAEAALLNPENFSAEKARRGTFQVGKATQ